MRALLAMIALFAMVGPASGETTGRADEMQDHLAPVNLKVFKQYREVLDDKLGVTPFDCGRAMTQPSSEGESAVSVYSRPAKNKRRIYYVTFTKAEANLWQRREAPRKVKVRRIDAEIPSQTARNLKLVWLRMLQDARDSEATPLPKRQAVVAEGTLMEFSIQRSKGAPLFGEIVVSLPNIGKNIAALTNLSVTLADYCQSSATERVELNTSINRQALQLLVALRAKKP